MDRLSTAIAAPIPTTSGTVHGYARVSTDEQVTHLQVDALRQAGASRIWEDHASGATTARPGLDAMLAAIRPGDTVLVWRLDRLGRSLVHLATLAEDLHRRGIRLRSITDGVDTSTSSGRLMLGLLGTLAEYERETIRSRVSAGLVSARHRGVLLGRRPSLTTNQVAEARKMREQGRGYREIGQLFRVSHMTVRRALQGTQQGERAS